MIFAIVINPKFNFSVFVDTRNERLGFVLEKAGDSWKRLDQGISVVLPGTVRGNEDERCNSGIHQGNAFQIIPADFSVFGEHHPTAFPAFD